MAGKPGRSGGSRPGAGRKKKEPTTLEVKPVLDESSEKQVPSGQVSAAMLLHKDPKAFLMALMNDVEADIKVRADAAKTLMPFVHKKLGEGGKKDQAQDEAKKVAGRFGAAAPPRLAAAGGKRL